MQDDANNIFRASLPDPFCVLGLTLKPFSLGHYYNLTRHGCAFVSEKHEQATVDDLIFACLVCSMTFDEFNAWLNMPPLTVAARVREVLKSRSWREVVVSLSGSKPMLDVVRWGRKFGVFSVAEKAELFCRYLAEHSKQPRIWIEKESDGSGSHWAHNIFVTLTGQLGFTREQALNIPLREALLHFYKHAENMGIVRLMTDEEIELIEASERGARGS